MHPITANALLNSFQTKNSNCNEYENLRLMTLDNKWVVKIFYISLLLKFKMLIEYFVVTINRYSFSIVKNTIIQINDGSFVEIFFKHHI